jgi:cytochrome c oxidase assembly factor CtaG
MLWSLPTRWRAPALDGWHRGLRRQRGRGRIALLVVATSIHVLTVWAWHLPVLYDAAASNDAIHGAEHLCFVLTACALWWAVGLGPVAVRGQAIMALFVSSLAGTALGIAMLLAAHPWYSNYPSLADQQVGAVIMWAFPGLGYAIAAAALFVTWVARSDRRDPRERERATPDVAHRRPAAEGAHR